MTTTQIKVLLIEDNLTDALLVRSELTQTQNVQFGVTHVERLSAALKQLQLQHFDAILLDLSLPDSDGFETFTQIHNAARNIPIMLLTNRADETLALRALKTGAQDYLLKEKMMENVLPRITRYAIERKQAEEALRQSEQLLQTMFERAPLGIALVNSLTGEFFNVNLKYAQILGHTLETIKHTDRMQIAHPDDLQEYLDNVALLRAGKISEFKTVSRFIRPDGTIVWINLSAVTINYKGDGPCHLCMIEDTTEKRQMMEKLQALTTHLQIVREEERTSISREIHDELGSMLTVIKMELEWFAKKIDATPIHERILAMHQLSGEALGVARRIARNLRPHVLDNLRLDGAIEWLVQEFKQHLGINCQLIINTVNLPRFDEKQNTNIFRIIQETLTNITRHAQATAVEIEISETDENFVIEIRDNGIGITRQNLLNQKSFGIAGMYERAKQLDGELRIDGTSSQGSTVQLRIPRCATE